MGHEGELQTEKDRELQDLRMYLATKKSEEIKLAKRIIRAVIENLPGPNHLLATALFDPHGPAQRLDLIGPFPNELRLFASKVAVVGGLPVDGPPQL